MGAVLTGTEHGVGWLAWRRVTGVIGWFRGGRRRGRWGTIRMRAARDNVCNVGGVWGVAEGTDGTPVGVRPGYWCQVEWLTLAGGWNPWGRVGG